MMTISIQKTTDLDWVNNLQLQSRNNNASAAYKRESQASQQQDDPSANKNKFSTEMQAFTAAPVIEEPVVIRFTGIAEMNALRLQFFLALERQIVHFRLSGLDSENAG